MEDDYKKYEYNAADTAVSEKLKTLYVNPGCCVTANLYRDEDGRIFVFWYWMTGHGMGQDHRSSVVESVEELRECLLEDAGSWVSEEEVSRICDECKEFF